MSTKNFDGGDDIDDNNNHYNDRGVRVLSFDIRTGTMSLLGTSNWWKVADSAGVCTRDGPHGVIIDPPNLFMNSSIGVSDILNKGVEPPLLLPRQIQP